jgi:hypothetical protein
MNNTMMKKAEPKPLIERKGNEARYGGEPLGPEAPLFWEQDLMWHYYYTRAW